jgi:hypothetical protein
MCVGSCEFQLSGLLTEKIRCAQVHSREEDPVQLFQFCWHAPLPFIPSRHTFGDWQLPGQARQWGP